jgi:hypothetical protein
MDTLIDLSFLQQTTMGDFDQSLKHQASWVHSFVGGGGGNINSRREYKKYYSV